MEQEEGGWSWLVVLASFLCVMVLDGIGYSYGVFLGPVQGELQGSTGVMAIGGSAQICAYGFSCPLVAKLVERYGARLPCMLGAVISCFGLVAASFTTSIPSFILCYSVITGLGFGLMYLPSIVIVSRHFVARRSLVTGLVLCAAGVGTFLVAPLAAHWMEQYGWRGSLRCLAVLCLACLVCGAAMVPGPRHLQQEEEETPESGSREVGSSSCLSSLLGPSMATSPLLPAFLLLALADCLACLALYIPYTHLPATATAAVQAAAPNFGANLISLVGVSNTIGRVGAGWLADQPWLPPLLLITSVIWAAVPPLLLFAFTSNPALFQVLAVLFGLFTGMWVSAVPAALVNLLGVDLLAQAFGLLTLVRGLAALTGPPLAGVLVDLTHSPSTALLVAATGMAASGIFYSAVVVLNRRLSRHSEYTQL